MYVLIILSSFAFMIYGVLVLSSDHMTEEFERYGLLKFRVLTGVLELLGGFGLLAGILYPVLLLLSSGGLCLLMFLGAAVRLRVKDPFIQIIPALLLMMVNGYIFYDAFLSSS